ncbi:hypothetical protein LU293_02075 [Moraxella nasovis]|uniref:hypothetical protein n=1 Tax=Moraxella nasovis TaxID=2904121 RepID=UPI001F613DBF|nr:hypothetical protein [Moraxella nasovis]UNU73720.1 hypothetical protein LU293_02075 [Moraxella nasovis]
MAVLIIALIDIAFCIFNLFLVKKGKFEQIQLQKQHSTTNHNSFHHQLDRKSVYLLCALLGFLGIHIISFNITTPIIFQEIRQWTAQDYGLSSACAGVGLFRQFFEKWCQKMFGDGVFDDCG